MASTNKTANLGLNQWVESDPFLREDANADNSKIDAAVQGVRGQISAMPYVKLFDITTTSDVTQIDLDFSKIDCRQFAKLEIIANILGIRTNDGGYGDANFSINNGTAEMRWRDSMQNTQTRQTKLRCFSTGTSVNDGVCFFAEIAGQFTGAKSALVLRSYSLRPPDGLSWYNCHVILPTLSNLCFSADTSLMPCLLSGSKILVYGVRI